MGIVVLMMTLAWTGRPARRRSAWRFVERGVAPWMEECGAGQCFGRGSVIMLHAERGSRFVTCRRKNARCDDESVWLAPQPNMKGMIMKCCMLGVAVIALQSALVAQVQSADTEQPLSQPAIELPTGVANTEGTLGFVCGEKEGIDCLDLETGRTQWHSSEATKPLLVHENLIWSEVGSGNSARLIGLDLATGNKVLESEPITLPDWAKVTAATNGPVTFSSRPPWRHGPVRYVTGGSLNLIIGVAASRIQTRRRRANGQPRA